MPYDLSLQQYVRSEFDREPPASWITRLREVSPIMDSVGHLRFRWFDPRPSWLHHDRGLWTLYSCTPRHLVSESRARAFEKHWSELPRDLQDVRHELVSDYQHYMWHAHGVDVSPFWVLQGEHGGTPAVYTRREERLLDACNAPSEPFPLGFFPACPFDERSVRQIQARDRLLKANERLDSLERMKRPEVLKAEDEAIEREFRVKFLDWWFETTKEQAEFMKTYLRTKEADQTLPRATRAEANAVSQWKDHYIEHGVVIGAGVAQSKKGHILIPASVS